MCLCGVQQDWLDEIERTKANKVTLDKQNVERAQQQHQRERQISLSKEDSLESTNRMCPAVPPSLAVWQSWGGALWCGGNVVQCGLVCCCPVVVYCDASYLKVF